MQSSKSFSVITFGCKINQFESNGFFADMVASGFLPVNNDSIADVIIINSCSVTNRTEKKILKKIRQLKRGRPDCFVVVAGCFSEVYPEVLKEKSGIDMISGNLQRSDLVEKLSGMFEPSGECSTVEAKVSAVKRTREFLKITDGCNNRCSYCVIWKARGAVTSESPETVSDWVGRSIAEGYREIVLLGTQLSDYGIDLETSLAELVKLLYKRFGDTRVRIRLSSLEPLDVKIFDFLKDYLASGFICRHLHIPLQSLNDNVLARMGRNYSVQDIFNIFETCFEISGMCIGVDVITGFPGETKEEFQTTCSNLKKLKGLAYLHVFPFSPKINTPACEFSGQVDPAEKKKRVAVLNDLSHELRYRFYSSFLGKTVKVLVEDMKDESRFEGTTDNFLKVIIEGGAETRINCIENIEIHDVIGYNTSLRLIGKKND